MKRLMMAVVIGAVALAGCVSVDGTRTQLNSKDAAEVKKAEDTIYAIATTGKDPTGFNQFVSRQQVEFVNLSSNNELLFRVFDNASDVNVIVAAVERMDFSKSGVAYSFAKERFGRMGEISEMLFREHQEELRNRLQGLEKMIISKMTQDELLKLLDNKEGAGRAAGRNRGARSRGGSAVSNRSLGEAKEWIEDRLCEITDSPEVLIRFGKWKRLLSMLDKVTDVQTIEKLLIGDAEANIYRVERVEDRLVLLKKLPQERMVELALKDIEKVFTEYNSKYGRKYSSFGSSICDDCDFATLETGIKVAANVHVNDEKSAVKIVKAVLSELTHCNVDGRNKLLAGIPKLSDPAIVELVCMDDYTWESLMDKVTSDAAYDILTHGKATCGNLEVALVKKLQPEKVDLKVFAGVTTDSGKKAVLAAMPSEVKKAAQEIKEKAFAAVMGKSKEASKETFEMHGFYLGMDWDDMKVVLSHHFPDYEMTEKRDGDNADSAYVVYIPKQTTPFCYASAKDKKVYQFNFGKQVLKKWYKYDAQDYRAWARMYSRENKVDLKYKMIDKITEVYEQDLSASYKVWFHQESYQYKHNAKEYRLTYFGEEKDFTAHGGIGGVVIKAMAAREFRYIRDDPGTLRAAIERD